MYVCVNRDHTNDCLPVKMVGASGCSITPGRVRSISVSASMSTGKGENVLVSVARLAVNTLGERELAMIKSDWL